MRAYALTCGYRSLKIVAGYTARVINICNALTSTLQVATCNGLIFTRSLLQVAAGQLQVADLRLQVVAGSLQVQGPNPRCRSGRGYVVPRPATGRG